MTWLGIVAIIAAFCALLVTFGASAEARLRGPLDLIEAVGFLLIVALLIYGGLVYGFSRVGYFRRRMAFQHASRAELDDFCATTDAEVSILIPSYKEEPPIIRQTLLSAALQEYPNRRVVLLIDDPPRPSADHERAALRATRALPQELERLLREARSPFHRALQSAQDRARLRTLDGAKETECLASLYEHAAAWFRARAGDETVAGHSDALFVQMCLRDPAARHGATAAELRHRVLEGGPYESAEEILRRYRHLDSLFAAQITSFERKRYANLSHAPNKAMNLNSYISLMGSDVAARHRDGGVELDKVAPQEADFSAPDASYILTLDADSLLAPTYTARLVRFLEDPRNARVAVAQTPYSAVPGAPGSTERVAGATTDLQYIIHQGFTAHGATYWVGANAVLRKRAVEEIVSLVTDDATGRLHPRYIQDRTVIEDTESTIDLLAHGWQLFNYPARLSYSATPPDFGALVVQRRRWANGGLLILPKLLRLLVTRNLGGGCLHGFMRVHYLISIAAVNVGILILFLVPFPQWFVNVWLPATAVPYFALYAHDLRQAGYRRRDVAPVYALNLLLIAVNIGGVLGSLRQAFTGRGSAFKRTPKVSGRTTAPPTYILAPCLLMLLLFSGAAWSIVGGSVAQGIASAANGFLLLYAISAFVGWEHGRRDVVTQIRPPRFLTAAERTATAGATSPRCDLSGRSLHRRCARRHRRRTAT